MRLDLLSPGALHPIAMQKHLLRIKAAKSSIQRATMTSNLKEAEQIIQNACAQLENWTVDFDEEFIQEDLSCCENPFTTILAQARHRLGQIALQRGDLFTASQFFLQVILHDPHTLSPTALAMTWYDVALIFMTYGNMAQAEESLQQSFASVMQHGGQDQTLVLFIRQAMVRFIEISQNCPCASSLAPLPWSIQFTVVTYNFEEPEEMPSNIQEEATKLLDPSVWAAGAA
jgi:tetratricopeptide (TPR) repeat protein